MADVTYFRGPVLSMFPTESERSTLREPGAGSGILSKELGRSKRKYPESVLRQEMDKSAAAMIDRFAGEYLGAIDLCLLKFAAVSRKFLGKQITKLSPKTESGDPRIPFAFNLKPGALAARKVPDPVTDVPAKSRRAAAPAPTAPAPASAQPKHWLEGGPPSPSGKVSGPSPMRGPAMQTDPRGGKTVAPQAPQPAPKPTALPMADVFAKGYGPAAPAAKPAAPAPTPAVKPAAPPADVFAKGPTAMPVAGTRMAPGGMGITPDVSAAMPGGKPFVPSAKPAAPAPAPAPAPTPAPSPRDEAVRQMMHGMDVPGAKAQPKRVMEDIRMGGKSGAQPPPPGATAPTEFKPAAKPETQKGGKGAAKGEFTQEQMQRFQEAQMGSKKYEAFKQKQGLTEMPEWKNFLLQTGMGIAPAMLLNAMGVEGMAPWMIAMTAPQFATPYVKKMLGYDPRAMEAAPMMYAKGQTKKQWEQAQSKMKKSASFDIVTVLRERLHQAAQ